MRRQLARAIAALAQLTDPEIGGEVEFGEALDSRKIRRSAQRNHNAIVRSAPLLVIPVQPCVRHHTPPRGSLITYTTLFAAVPP